MTEIGVEHNFRRLTFFLHSEMVWEAEERRALDFLREYSRIMDYHGCGREQLSWIFLETSDFKELREFALGEEGFCFHEIEELPDNVISLSEKKSYFRFQYGTFIWHVFEITNYFRNPKH